ncbi:pentapeptide repeat-containing protein [Micromonospora echinospora]|uniref:pentapeptide repeat-containing protein n=1 Tax=Micromonospora echinospora TaxID=1877 RepID=UPI0033F6CA05
MSRRRWPPNGVLGAWSGRHASGYAGFRLARFARLASFRWTVFRGESSFERTVVDGRSNFGRARFRGTVTFSDARLSRRPLVAQTHASAAGGHVWPGGVTARRVDEDWLVLVDPCPVRFSASYGR